MDQEPRGLGGGGPGGGEGATGTETLLGEAGEKGRKGQGTDSWGVTGGDPGFLFNEKRSYGRFMWGVN